MAQKIRFIHTADIHLGKSLYGIDQRYHDHFNVFEWLLDKAIREEVNFILISGDFIDSERKINPSTLSNIITTIKDFQSKSKEELDREIPIICILGNHETPFFSDHTWLKLLADLDLIILLSGEYDNRSRRIMFEDYSYREDRGGKIEIVDNVVVYGMSYFGSSTPELYPLIDKEIPDDDKFNILMMHFGIEGEDKRKKGYKFNKNLRKLHKKVDYLALGHFHKQYQKPEKEPWIYNPGSLEVNEITEVAESRGIFLVEIFPDEDYFYHVKSINCENGPTHETGYIPNRQFMSYPIDISESKSFDEAQTMVLEKLRKLGVPEQTETSLSPSNLAVPVLYLTLQGQINYSELEIDLSELKKNISNKFDILGLKLNNQIFTIMGEGLEKSDDWNFDDIEKQAFLKTIEGEELFKPYKDEITHLILDQLKSKVLKKADNSIIKKEIDDWFSIHNKILDELVRITRVKKKSTKTTKKPKKKKKKKKRKKKKRKEKQVAIDEPWTDEELSKELGGLTDLLGEGPDEEEEFNIDDIIDDGDTEI